MPETAKSGYCDNTLPGLVIYTMEIVADNCSILSDT